MHNIENENNTLEKLLIKIKDSNARKQDFIAPTKELQFRTLEQDNHPQSEIVIEGSGGEPTRFLKVNDLCFDQIAQKNGLDVRTARRLQSEYSREYDSLTNAIWQKGSYALRKLYHETNNPLIVIYTSPNCGPCHVLKPQLKRVLDELEGNAQCVEIDIELEPQIAQQAGVNGTPTVQLFKNKALVNSWRGVQQRSTFKEAILKLSSNES